MASVIEGQRGWMAVCEPVGNGWFVVSVPVAGSWVSVHLKRADGKGVPSMVQVFRVLEQFGVDARAPWEPR